MIKRILSITVVLSVVVSLVSCIMINDSKEIFENWVPEDKINACYVNFENNNEIWFDNKEVNFDEDDVDLSIDEAIVKVGDLVYCVSFSDPVEQDDDLYGVYENYILFLALNVKTLDKTVLYTHYINPVRSDVPYKKIRELETVYSNYQIAFYDGISSYVFNISDSTVEKIETSSFYSYSSSGYEIERTPWEFDANDERFKEITVISPNDKRVITIDYMAQRHEYVKQLVDVRHYEGFPESRDLMENFFQGTYVFGDEIYLECMFFDYDGERNTLFFSYDYETDTFKFIRHFFSSGYPSMYLIPIETASNE